MHELTLVQPTKLVYCVCKTKKGGYGKSPAKHVLGVLCLLSFLLNLLLRVTPPRVHTCIQSIVHTPRVEEFEFAPIDA